MLERIKSTLLNSPEWIIAICVFVVYWLVSKAFTGPTVLNDEIGYLANAALISGYNIDGASSYHAGYSFFLAPFFLLFSEPSQIWQSAMALNAFMWALSFLLLARILKIIAPQYNKGQLFTALLISAIYPTWIIMSGYVFTTTAFVFIYLLAVLTFLFWKPDRPWTIIPHALAVGYLYWIHPVGLAVCVASFIVVAYVSVMEKKYASMIFNFIALAVLIILYREVIDKWLVLVATPEVVTTPEVVATAEEYVPLYRHYPDSESIVSRLFKNDFWIRFFAKSAGKISYLIVSSFGFIYFGFIAAANKTRLLIKNKSNQSLDELTTNSTYAFLALSLLGILAIGVIFFSIGSSTRIDQWIYGRYTEMVALPLFALGYLTTWHKKSLLFAFFFVLSTGILLNQVVDPELTNLHITTVAFWPQYLYIETNFLYWMAAGALAMLLLGLVRDNSKLANYLVLAIIAIIFIFSTVVQVLIHHSRIAAFGTPSEFVEIIRENYPPGTCVGVNPAGFGSIRDNPQTQEYHLHLFYLYDYAYRRMLPEEWLNSCDGPYLTFTLDGLDEEQGVKLLGHDLHSNFFMLIKDDRQNITVPEGSNSTTFTDAYND